MMAQMTTKTTTQMTMTDEESEKGTTMRMDEPQMLTTDDESNVEADDESNVEADDETDEDSDDVDRW